MARIFLSENKQAELWSIENLGRVLLAESSQRHDTGSGPYYSAVLTSLESFRNGMRSFDEIPVLKDL